MRDNQTCYYAIQGMDISLDELIGHLAKKRKSWKRRRDNDEAEVKKEGAMVVNEAPAPLESIVEEVLG